MDLLFVAFIVCFLSALPSGQAQACPYGQSVVNCSVDPCSSSPCGTGKTCVPNYCGGCNYDCKTENKCKVGDKQYEPGETFPAGDGCNTCTCTQSGLAICTLIACPVCTYNGTTYKPGDQFPSTDGCKTCSCLQDGSVSCSESACMPTCHFKGNVYQNATGFRSPGGCNACFCHTVIRCTLAICDKSSSIEGVPKCHFDGNASQVETTYLTPAGCSRCCRASGSIRCTQKMCLPTCHFDGNVYQAGTSFLSPDGCNTCLCSQGSIRCTQKICPPVCPQLNCTRCDHGYVLDKDGCQTCECKGEPCGSKTCATDEYCSGSDCCPKWTKNARCENPCSVSRVYCGKEKTCQPYCGCLAMCK